MTAWWFSDAVLCVLALLAARYLCACLAKGADRFAWRRDFRSESGEIYMTRIQLLRSPWVDIYVNVIRTPDYDPYPHSHPWLRAWSLKLWNGYLEEIFWGPALVFRHFRTPSRWSRVPEIHRIVRLNHDRPAVTLFVGVGRRGSWGFFDLDNGGRFIPHNARGQRGK